MSIAACAEQVRRGDPDRFLSAMTAPPATRGRLFVLYAFNLEIARAPWLASEPVIAAMRLRFWRDVVTGAAEGEAPRAHEVAAPLAALIREAGLPTDALLKMIAAREAEAERPRFADAGAVADHVAKGAGSLMWLSAYALDPDGADERQSRQAGLAQGLAAFLAALPGMSTRGWRPLPAPERDSVCALAEIGLDALAEARRRGRASRRARPALRAAWQAGALLRMARENPDAVLKGGLALSEFRRRGSLLAITLSRRW